MPATEPLAIHCAAVLLPDKEQARLSIEVSRLLASQGSIFTLDDRNFYAHASLYFFEMDINTRDNCVTALQYITTKTKIQHLKQSGYAYQDSGYYKGYIDIEFNRNTEVDDLQMLVVDTLNKFRAGVSESIKAKIAEATGQRLENLQTYGYPSVGELFRPHITFTRFRPEVEPDLSVLPSSANFNGNFDRIGLFEMGENGTCVCKLAEFNLVA